MIVSILRVGLAVSLLGAGGALARPWTNAAGHAIEGEFISLADGQVTLARPDGRQVTLKLFSLCPEDQQAARELAGQPDLPAVLRADYERAAQQIRRLQVMLQHGAVTPAEYETRKHEYIRSFRLAANRNPGSPEQTKTSAEWIPRLAAQLDQL